MLRARSRLLHGRRRRRQLRDDLDAEIETHLAQRTDELIAAGLDPETARQEAWRRFGDPDRARRTLYRTALERDARLAFHEWLRSVARDALMSVRRAREAPMRTALTVLVFALGVGLTTSMFALVDHTLLRGLDFPDSDELVSLMSVDEQRNAFPYVSSPNWFDWERDNETLASSAIYYPESFDVMVGDRVERVVGHETSGRFFEVLGAPMLRGRPYTVDEAQDEAPVLVVSEGFWRRELGSRPLDELTVRVDGRPLRVIGVVERRYVYPQGTPMWVPKRFIRRVGSPRNSINWYALGRLRDGVSREQAAADLSTIADGIREQDPVALYSYGVGVRPLQDFVVGGTGDQLLLLMGAVSVLLLLACANLAGLSFASISGRAREMAIRSAIGAGRHRIVRQVLTEQVVWALFGGILGILAAQAGVGLLAGSGEWAVPRAAEARIDLRVALFGIAVALVAGVLAGLPPALRAAGSAPGSGLRRWRGRRAARRDLPGARLVAAEMALAVLLLTGGSLLMRSLVSMTSRDLGFEPEGLVAVEVMLPDIERYASDEARTAYWDSLVDAARALPEVASAGLANAVPGRPGAGNGFIEVEGLEASRIGAEYRMVDDGYLRMLDPPLHAGRHFGPDDRRGSERVTIINRAMADAYWPDSSPIGRRVRATSMEGWLHEGQAPWLTVVGVVGDIRSGGFAADHTPQMQVVFRQLPQGMRSMTLLVRARGEVGSLVSTLRQTFRDLDPEIAFAPVHLGDALADLLAGSRWLTSVLNGFAVLAVFLAGIGLYGLVSHAVSTQRYELAVRAALGSTRIGILLLMLRRSLRLVAAGAIVGLVAALWASRLLASMLVDIEPLDPIAFTVATGVLGAVALAAALTPSWRASRLDPAASLKAPG